MRYLPLFLDVSAGPVVLVGCGEPAHAKLRLLLAAGARVRWYGDQEPMVSDPALAQAESDGRIERVKGDPLDDPLEGVIAVLCAGAGEAGCAAS